jgi:tetratricopeptide (TPR) repeat protein
VHERFGDVLYFRVLDMTGHAAFDEITYGKVEGAKSVRITQEVGGDLLVVGRAAGVVDDTRGTDQAEVKEGTGYFKKEKNLDGEWVDVEITRTVIRTLPYVIRHASLNTDYMVFDLRTGELIAMSMVSEEQNKKFGGAKPDGDLEYQPSEAPPPAASLDDLSTRAARKLVAEISRMKVIATVQLDKGMNRLVRRGVVMAKRGDWEHAMRYWNDAIHKEPTDAAAYYNLGVAHETLGDFENLSAARSLYEKATTLGDNPLYTEAIARIDRIVDRRRDN